MNQSYASFVFAQRFYMQHDRARPRATPHSADNRGIVTNNKQIRFVLKMQATQIMKSAPQTSYSEIRCVCKQASAVKAAVRNRADAKRQRKNTHTHTVCALTVYDKAQKHENNVHPKTQLLDRTWQPQTKFCINKH